MDELRLQVATDNAIKNSCILLITETRLHSHILDSAIQLADHTAQHSAGTGQDKWLW